MTVWMIMDRIITSWIWAGWRRGIPLVVMMRVIMVMTRISGNRTWTTRWCGWFYWVRIMIVLVLTRMTRLGSVQIGSKQLKEDEDVSTVFVSWLCECSWLWVGVITSKHDVVIFIFLVGSSNPKRVQGPPSIWRLIICFHSALSFKARVRDVAISTSPWFY